MFAIGVGILLAVRTVAVYVFWGTFVTTPIARPDLSMSVFDALREVGARAIGLLFSRDYGLLWLAPVYLLAIAGLRLIRSTPWLDARMTWALLIAYLATLLTPYANPYGVAGGFAPASRMIVPVVPLLAVAVFAAARALPTPARLLVVLQIAIDVRVSHVGFATESEAAAESRVAIPTGGFVACLQFVFAAFTAIGISRFETKSITKIKVALEIQSRTGIVGTRKVCLAAWDGDNAPHFDFVFWPIG